MDEIFKALADANRRRMLDILKECPGLTVNELAARFSFSRYAVMKHLRILENAELVVFHRQGREKHLYVNPVPIRLVQKRWISRFEDAWQADVLIRLKRNRESGS